MERVHVLKAFIKKGRSSNNIDCHSKNAIISKKKLSHLANHNQGNLHELNSKVTKRWLKKKKGEKSGCGNLLSKIYWDYTGSKTQIDISEDYVKVNM